MARCPNCNKKLHLTDWKQYCPHCGVNLIYFKSNERLLAESEKAEIEHAKHQPGIDRAKASFFGSPPAIARVVISALPLAALFLPLCKISDKNINAISIYKYISDAGFGTIIGKALKIKFPENLTDIQKESVLLTIKDNLQTSLNTYKKTKSITVATKPTKAKFTICISKCLLLLKFYI